VPHRRELLVRRPDEPFHKFGLADLVEAVIYDVPEEELDDSVFRP